jgi:hypothetical protein
MPESHNYIVQETREVKVIANNPSDACAIAAAAFKHGQNSDAGVANGKGPQGVWGNTRNRIRVKEIRAKEEV